MPKDHFSVPEELHAIHAVTPQAPSGHICTGPIWVEGARPNDVLQVDILDIELNSDWGFGLIRPLEGALPHDFKQPVLVHYAIDQHSREARLPWGQSIPLSPFFGLIGVAPPAEWGTISTIPPRHNGGNLDNKELVAGSTLFLPVFVDGALFSVGDGHGVQGDGEVCVTAIETHLKGTFRLTVHKNMSLTWPFAETKTHLISMAFDPSLDNCVTYALRALLDLVCQRTKLSREEAYLLCSLVADVRVTQVVNGNKGVHIMFPFAHLPGPRGGSCD